MNFQVKLLVQCICISFQSLFILVFRMEVCLNIRDSGYESDGTFKKKYPLGCSLVMLD